MNCRSGWVLREAWEGTNPGLVWRNPWGWLFSAWGGGLLKRAFVLKDKEGRAEEEVWTRWRTCSPSLLPSTFNPSYWGTLKKDLGLQPYLPRSSLPTILFLSPPFVWVFKGLFGRLQNKGYPSLSANDPLNIPWFLRLPSRPFNDNTPDNTTRALLPNFDVTWWVEESNFI
jgi:hypothetical protein